MNNIQPLNEKPPIKKKKKKKKGISLSDLNIVKSFSNFDPITGDKTADEKSEYLKRLELQSEALKGQTEPYSVKQTLKDAGTGGSLAFLGSSVLFKNNRLRGLIGVGSALASGYLSKKDQLARYNKQQAARELLIGKNTSRARLLKKMLDKKYGK